MQTVDLLKEEWEFLTLLLPKDWREQARQTGALRRARDVANADCLLKLILMRNRPAEPCGARTVCVGGHETIERA
jgi:hypothetical protein